MTWLMVVLMLALSSPAFGQMATTTATSTPPYDASTVEGYREWAIRFSAELCRLYSTLSHPRDFGSLQEPPGGWPAVDDISDAWFEWVNNPEGRGVDLEFRCLDRGSRTSTWPRLVVCNNERIVDGNRYGLPLPPGTCPELRLPPIGATVPHWELMLPEYGWYGEPLQTQNPPTPPPTPEPEPEGPNTPQEPVGNLEVPANGSFQSGIGYVSGWVCDAERVAIVIDGGLHLPPVARNISRGDTEAVCGDQDNGFILHWNYNLMGDGTYTAALVVDGKTLQENRFTVTTLGEEFVRGVERDVVVNDFPGPGENTRLRWQEPVQGFVLVPPTD